VVGLNKISYINIAIQDRSLHRDANRTSSLGGDIAEDTQTQCCNVAIDINEDERVRSACSRPDTITVSAAPSGRLPEHDHVPSAGGTP
jgi:hypothetical protein